MNPRGHTAAAVQLVELDVGLDLLLCFGERRAVVLFQEDKRMFQMRYGVRMPAGIQANGLKEVVLGLFLIFWSTRSELVDSAQVIMGDGVSGSQGNGILQVLASFIEQVVFQRQFAIVAFHLAHQQAEIWRSSLQAASCLAA